MKTTRITGTALAALVLASWGGAAPAPAAPALDVAESQTGYFGSGHEAGQGAAAPAPVPASGLEPA